jgi:nucleotide-binding universal stress UspA family protein
VSTSEPESRGPVLVGVDGSRSSVEALRWAAAYATSRGANLEVVIAWDWHRSVGWSVPILAGLHPEGDANHVLEECLAALRADWPDLVVDGRVEQGHPSPILVDASKGASLLAVGCRGHGEFSGMLLGSVSEFCATHAHCPVLVFRRDEEGVEPSVETTDPRC